MKNKLQSTDIQSITPDTSSGSAGIIAPVTQPTEGYHYTLNTRFTKKDVPPVTVGEHAFNAFDWYGIGWLANAAIGITMANKLSYGSWQPAFNAFNENLGTKWFTKEAFELMGGGGGAKATAAARGITQLAALMSGGYACMLPIKLIHDHKKPIVKTLDTWMGPKNPTDSQQKLTEARHAYLDHEPHISMWNAFEGRTASMAVILGVHYAIGQPSIARMINPKTTFTGFEKYLGELGEGSYKMLHATKPGARWMNQLEQKLGEHTAALKKRFAQQPDVTFQPIEGPEHAKKIMALTYEDLLYSLGGATGTMLFSKMFAHKSNEAREKPTQKVAHTHYNHTLQPTQQGQQL